MKTNNKGFSLVELIVVIAIMAILASVAIPTFATFIGKAQQASDIDFMNQVESAAELAFATKTEGVSAIAVKLNGKKIDTITITVDDKPYAFKNNQYTGAAITGDSALAAALEDFAKIVDFGYEFKSDADDLKSNPNWPADGAKPTWTLN